MNIKRKEGALKKIEEWKKTGAQSDDDFRQLLAQDEKMYSPEEIEEIIAAHSVAAIPESKPAQPAPAAPTTPVNETKRLQAAPGEYDPANPNASLDLSGINYNNLRDQALVDYAELTASLPQNKMYDWELYRVDLEKAPRYDGVRDSPIDIVGVRIKDNTPIMTTRLSAKNANNLNGIQIRKGRQGSFIEGAQFENTKKIYLLKKV